MNLETPLPQTSSNASVKSPLLLSTKYDFSDEKKIILQKLNLLGKKILKLRLSSGRLHKEKVIFCDALTCLHKITGKNKKVSIERKYSIGKEYKAIRKLVLNIVANNVFSSPYEKLSQLSDTYDVIDSMTHRIEKIKTDLCKGL